MRKKYGVIIGNRPTFPTDLCIASRVQLLRILQEEGVDPIVLAPEEGTAGTVKEYADSVKCSELFRSHSDEIVGIIVSLPNFGDERSVA